MGSWKTNKGIIISDGYADVLEDLADKDWKKLIIKILSQLEEKK